MEYSPSFVGGLVRLRPLKDSDLQTLLTWRNDPRSLFLWSTYRAILPDRESVEEFWADLRSDKHVLLVAENGQSEIVGMVYSYNAQFVDGHCSVTTYVAEQFRDRGYGIEIFGLFLDYLFSYFDFRKVYLDVYSYNRSSSRPIEKYGFVEEGRFPEHRYHDGNWHEMIRFAVYRQQLPKIRATLARLSRHKT